MDTNTFTKGIYTAKAHTQHAGNGQFQGYVILARDDGDDTENTRYDVHSTAQRGGSVRGGKGARAPDPRRNRAVARRHSGAAQSSRATIDSSIVSTSVDMNGNG